MADETRNVFISHVSEDDSGLQKLKDLLASHDYQIRDGSISANKPNNANSPEYIKSEILAPRIQWAGTLIVYISPGMRDSEFVDWEIEYAHKMGKRIVGVWELGGKDCPVPEAVGEYADAVVAWNAEGIIRAIDGEDAPWQDAGGVPRPPRDIKRYSCA